MIRRTLMGIVIGVANVIPGVSGGTMAVSMGIYDKLIFALTHIKSDFKNSIRTLIPIALGAGLGALALSFIIEYLFKHFPMQTNCLFIGLILGGLPTMIGKVKDSKVSVSKIVPCIFFFTLTIAMALMGQKEGVAVELSSGLIPAIQLFFIGVIIAATMVIPGVSGSMLLMLMGYYTPIIQSINAFIKAVVSFDFAQMARGMGILLPLGLGAVLGAFLIAKLVEIIFKKYRTHAYYAVIGLIAASPVAIMLVSEQGSVHAVSVLSSLLILILGWIAAYKLGEK